MIFVFGSNTGGIHGSGGAKTALNEHGAIYGQGNGRYGNSYAIPTKGVVETISGKLMLCDPLPLNIIDLYVQIFIEYAKQWPKESFQVTRIGCGLAGYHNNQMAPMFINAPDNCWFDGAWESWLGKDKKYWGAY